MVAIVADVAGLDNARHTFSEVLQTPAAVKVQVLQFGELANAYIYKGMASGSEYILI